VPPLAGKGGKKEKKKKAAGRPVGGEKRRSGTTRRKKKRRTSIPFSPGLKTGEKRKKTTFFNPTGKERKEKEKIRSSRTFHRGKEGETDGKKGGATIFLKKSGGGKTLCQMGT